MKYYGYSDADEAVLEIDITREDVIECIDKAVKGQEVDVIIGGPPCQAYSSLGRAKDDNAMQDDQRNYLFAWHNFQSKKHNDSFPNDT